MLTGVLRSVFASDRYRAATRTPSGPNRQALIGVFFMLDGSLQASLSRGPGLFQGLPPHCRIIFGTNRRNGRQVHTDRGLTLVGDPPGPRPPGHPPLSDNKVEPLTTVQKACSNLQVPACLVWRQAPVETRDAVFLFTISRAGVDILCRLVPCQLYHSSLCAADWYMRPHTFTMQYMIYQSSCLLLSSKWSRAPHADSG